MNLNNEAIKKAKELVQKAKEKKLIKPHTDAFKKYSVKEEQHKGSKKYMVN